MAGWARRAQKPNLPEVEGKPQIPWLADMGCRDITGEPATTLPTGRGGGAVAVESLGPSGFPKKVLGAWSCQEMRIRCPGAQHAPAAWQQPAQGSEPLTSSCLSAWESWGGPTFCSSPRSPVHPQIPSGVSLDRRGGEKSRNSPSLKQACPAAAQLGPKHFSQTRWALCRKMAERWPEGTYAHHDVAMKSG